MSNLLVQNIKHTNNTTAMAIDTSGSFAQMNLLKVMVVLQLLSLQQGLSKAWVNVIKGDID